MKFKTLTLLCLCLAAGTLPISAADTLQQTFQKGLFEEEGNQNLPAAIQAYESVLSQLDQQRKIAATTVFRLGECYRKLGKTNEATVQYQRVLREFGDQEVLAKLSQQNLSALSAKGLTPTKGEPTNAATSEEAQETERIKILIANSPDLINSPYRNNFTPLEEAASKGQLAVATFLLDHGADANLARGKSPLHFAVEQGHKTMVELLLSRGTDVNARDRDGNTALHTAVSRGFRSVAEVLIASKADVNAPQRRPASPTAVFSGATPLHHAALRNDRVLVDLLLQHSANSRAEDVSKQTPLHWAARSGSASLIERFWNSAANMNAKDASSRTPLYNAVEGSHVQVCEALLRHGADVNARINSQMMTSVTATEMMGSSSSGSQSVSCNGFIPLHLAVLKGYDEIARVLLANHAQVDANASEARTPLHLAVRYGSSAMVNLLLEHGADVNAMTWDGWPSVLMTAVKRSSEEIVAMILARKPKLDQRDDQRSTALQQAVGGHLERITDMLLEAGADPNVRSTNDGSTPLHWAVQAKRHGIIKSLLHYKADPNATTASGMTPLDYAKATLRQTGSRGQSPVPPGRISGDDPVSEIIKLLRQAGATDYPQLDSSILIGRNDAYLLAFSKGTNDLNRYTLFELIAGYYRDQSSTARNRGRGGSGARPTGPGPLDFPDFSRIIIQRTEKDGEKEIAVDLTAALQGGDCSKDIGLEWGDKIEIPETDHKLNERWGGLSNEASETLRKCLLRKVQIVVKGQVTEIILDPFAPETDPSASRGSERLDFQQRLAQLANQPKPADVVIGRFRLNQVLQSANVFRTSSDLTRIKVKRIDPATKQSQEMLFNLEQADPKTDLWLRDGDVIEVPEKE